MALIIITLNQDLLETPDLKFLIFAHHKCLLDGIEQQCKASKVRCSVHHSLRYFTLMLCNPSVLKTSL